MPRIVLTGGAYTAQSLLANCQRCVNLYPEANPPDSQAPVPVTHYLTPGLRKLASPPMSGAGRALYTASNGKVYTVVGQNVYYINDGYAYTLLGSISSPPNPAYIQDNGATAIVVDGTANGYTIDISSNAFAAIVDPDFYGGTRIDYSDLRFILNKPGTTIFYYSDTVATTFDPLDFAAKAGYPDLLQTIQVLRREIWLLGQFTSEVFYNAGATDAIFEQLPGSFMEHGCIAPYSVAKADVSIFWLGRDFQGRCIVFEGTNYQAKRISTHAIEYEFSKYVTVSDAVAFTYQQAGHVFYVLNFPTADKTWVYDVSIGLWHERAWIDEDGIEHRARPNCHTFGYGLNLCIDWETGDLYAYDTETYTDDGNPVPRIRTFPHLVDDGKRVFYQNLIADVQVGTILDSTPPSIYLRWSDTRGASWGQRVRQSLGDTGDYLTSVQWQRLGVARDRVFELSWSINAKTALNGAFIQSKTAGT